jgi:hypothetical protein
MKMRIFAGLLLALLLPTAAQAVPTLICSAVDAAGNPIKCTPVIVLDTTGAPVTPASSTGQQATTDAVNAMAAGLPTSRGAKPSTGSTSIVPAADATFVLAAGEAHIGEIGGNTVFAAANFTTPSGTTAYSSSQLIANSASAGSVTPLSFSACRVNGGTGMVRRVRIKTTDTGFAGQSVTLYLYRDSPTATNGDHATWLTTESNYLGAVAVTLDKHFSDYEKGIGVPVSGSEINFNCASGSSNIYGLVVAAGAITPQGAKVITATLEVLAN